MIEEDLFFPHTYTSRGRFALAMFGWIDKLDGKINREVEKTEASYRDKYTRRVDDDDDYTAQDGRAPEPPAPRTPVAAPTEPWLAAGLTDVERAELKETARVQAEVGVQRPKQSSSEAPVPAALASSPTAAAPNPYAKLLASPPAASRPHPHSLEAHVARTRDKQQQPARVASSPPISPTSSPRGAATSAPAPASPRTKTAAAHKEPVAVAAASPPSSAAMSPRREHAPTPASPARAPRSPAVVSTPKSPRAAQRSADDDMVVLRKLKECYEEGLITREEYDQRRRAVLDKIVGD